MSHLRLGTRKSPLALAQANLVLERIKQVHPHVTAQLVPLMSSGDQDLKTPLSELGGKGVFIKSLERALLDEEIDIAVHSFKDVTSKLEPGLKLSAFLHPESQSDCLVGPTRPPWAPPLSLHSLPKGAKIGTGSIRRKALLKKVRPDLDIFPIRGNVQTRLNLLQSHLDAVILSYVGLLRLDLHNRYAVQILDPTHFIPAPGQGVICVETRQKDANINQLMDTLSDPIQTPKSEIDLLILNKIDFNCRIPFGFYLGEDQAIGFLANQNMTDFWQPSWETVFALSHPEKIAQELAQKAKDWGW